MKDPVRCRADHAYPGRPTAVWFEGGWHEVKRIKDEQQSPTGKRYLVDCEGEYELWLVYDPASDRWRVTAANGSGT